MNKTYFLLVALTFTLAQRAEAFMWTGESAENVAPKAYRLGVYPQLKLSDGSGFNFAGGVSTGWSDSVSIGGHLGLGDTDFYGGAHVKWTPFPDFEKQPAIGFKFEGLVGREGSENIFGGKVHPIVSKKFDLSAGRFVPYGALPVGVTMFAGNTNFTAQLTGGTEFYTERMKNWGFGAELGVSLSKAFTYIMAFATYDLDSSSSNSSSPRLQRRTRR